MKTLTKSIAASLLALGAASVSASTIVQTGDFPSPGGTSTTNFANQPVVPDFNQFNPALGTLNSVTIDLTGLVTGDVRAESLDASPATVTLNLQAIVDFLVGATTLAQVIPTASTVNALAAFDGTIDFAGPSGISLTGLSGTDSDTVVLTGAAMSPWIGTGTVTGLCSGTGSSSGTGAGNLVTQFATQAGCGVTVTYDYNVRPTGPVPEIDVIAGTGALTVLAGALALVGERRRRRSS